jgi:ribulose kinase
MIQLELEEVREKRLTKSWIQRHDSNNIQTSLSAATKCTVRDDVRQPTQRVTIATASTVSTPVINSRSSKKTAAPDAVISLRNKGYFK